MPFEASELKKTSKINSRFVDVHNGKSTKLSNSMNDARDEKFSVGSAREMPVFNPFLN